MSKISDLKFDDKNFNKHTEFGMGLLEKSLRENGAGRSILLDKDNNIKRQITADNFIPLPMWWQKEELNVYRLAGGGLEGIDAVIKYEERNFYGK